MREFQWRWEVAGLCTTTNPWSCWWTWPETRSPPVSLSGSGARCPRGEQRHLQDQFDIKMIFQVRCQTRLPGLDRTWLPAGVWCGGKVPSPTLSSPHVPPPPGPNWDGQGVEAGVWGQLDDSRHGAHWLPCGRQLCHQACTQYSTSCLSCIERLPGHWINIVLTDGGLKTAGARTEARKVTFSWHRTGSRLVKYLLSSLYQYLLLLLLLARDVDVTNDNLSGVCVWNRGWQKVGAKGGSWDRWGDQKICHLKICRLDFLFYGYVVKTLIRRTGACCPASLGSSWCSRFLVASSLLRSNISRINRMLPLIAYHPFLANSI